MLHVSEVMAASGSKITRFRGMWLIIADGLPCMVSATLAVVGCVMAGLE